MYDKNPPENGGFVSNLITQTVIYTVWVIGLFPTPANN